MNTQRKRNRVDRKWLNERLSPRFHALWTVLGMLALVLAASCGSEVTGGNGGQGGNGGAGGDADCLTGACDLPNGDAVDESPARVAGNADEAIAQPIPTNAIPCTLDGQCASGFCTDGVCCDRRCDDVCMACSVAKQGQGVDGVCGPIKNDTDPDNECAGADSCDGGYVCKRHNGVTCTLWSQCLSNYCVDGFCCNSYCDGECSACSTAKKGDGTQDGLCGKIKTGTDPDNECNPGACNGTGACSSPQAKLPLGSSCISAAQCSSGQCADGVCCDFLCVDRTCQACTAAKKGGGVDGICGPIKYDTDPDNECWGGGCNGAGECKRYNNQPCSFTSQCLSTYCVDGVCCNNHCMDGCFACTAAKTGVEDGKCKPIITGTDPDYECGPGVCTASQTCSAPHPPQADGTPCSGGTQCASGFCADGVCCNDWCIGDCKACTAAKKGQGSDGTCGNVKSGLDTEGECNGGVCDGIGACRNTNGAPCTSPGQCFSNYCVEGVCCGNICNLSCESCMASKKGGGNDGECGPIVAYTDPDNECPDPRQCNGTGNCGLPNGEVCTVSAACISGNCIDGVCCNSACGGGATNDCQACNVAGSVGTCKQSPANTTCRPIAGACDVAEVCDGSVITCPMDKYVAANAVCRTATDFCDTAESCTGASPVCPLDIVKPAGTTCRISAGGCDIAETCNGSAKACPTDVYVASGTVCRLAAATDACDNSETCTGASPACPPDIVKPAGTTCRISAGGCDIAETCNGSAKACPTDVYAASGTVCRIATDLCDNAEACTGSNAQCPTDSVKPLGTTCRISAGVCDVAESCNGGLKTCPANGYAPPSTVCRSVAGVCDIAENCTGNGALCPNDVVKSSGTVCRAAVGTCDLTESCNGSSGLCPSNKFVSAGTVCVGASCANSTTWNNADTCNGAGSCVDGGTHACSAGCGGGICHGIMPVSGSWYYPAKNGAGFVISHNIYNTVDIAWFTYLSDGTPIWYIADTTEVNGEFTGTLLMTHWQNGQKTNIDVGQLTLNTTSSTTGTISWVLNGVPGSEPVEYLVFNDGGWSPNITGNWYDPNQPGWGILADVQGSKLVPTVALYDTAGQPTWVHYNGGAWNGSAFDSVLMQVTGVNLCPSCTGPTSFTYVNVGSMQVSNIYDSGVGFYNHATLNMSFTPPSGLSQWNRSNVALARLTF